MDENEKLNLIKNAEYMLNNNLTIMSELIAQNWLSSLSESQIAICENGASEVLMELYDMEKLVYDAEEGIIDRLASVYSAMHSCGATIFLLIHSDGIKNKFYIGCRHHKQPDIAGSLLKKSLYGNFPGISLKKVKDKEEVLEKCVPLTYHRQNIVSLAVRPNFRHEHGQDKTGYVQGIEKFIEGMSGEEYTTIIIAEPETRADIAAKKNVYENMITELSKYNRFTLTYGENESHAVTTGMSRSLSETISDSIGKAVSTSTTRSVGNSISVSHNDSFNLNALFLGLGWGDSTTLGHNTGKAKTKSNSVTKTRTTSTGETVTETESETDTAGTTNSITINIEDKHVTGMVQQLEQTLQMLIQAEAFGMWKTAAYFLSAKRNTAMIAANNFKSLVIGDPSGNNECFINSWEDDTKSYYSGVTSEILRFLHYGMHPVFNRQVTVVDNTNKVQRNQLMTSAILVSGKELPVLLGFPQKSVSGVLVTDMAEFGREVIRDSEIGEGKRRIHIGKIMHMGKVDKKNSVDISANTLCGHCFVCGIPGSGKSNAVYQILQELSDLENGSVSDEGYKAVHFLIVEPAKGEYKLRFGGMKGINIFTTSPRQFSMLRLNPFIFPYEHIMVGEHVEKLLDVFSTCWPLYAAMPAILKQAFVQAYRQCGWDMKRSVYVLPGKMKFPTFQNVLQNLPMIINNSSYSSQSKGDYIGSLVTRVESLTTGTAGDIFCDSNSVSDKVLFDENTIVDLSRIGSTETKALIMGVLIIKLNEYRQATATRTDYPLRHVTVLEEAHNILPRTSTDQSSETSNVLGKSVEMITASIAEMRTYGEGFLIVDQSPSAVAKTAISNTNTKIIMGLSDYEDCQAAGHSIALEDLQINELAKLSRGTAVIRQGNWVNPTLTLVEKAENRYSIATAVENPYEDICEFRQKLLSEVFRLQKSFNKTEKMDAGIKDLIQQKIKRSLLPYQESERFLRLWIEYCNLDMESRIRMLPKFTVEILEFEEPLLILQPDLPALLIPYANTTEEMRKNAKQWLANIEKVLPEYVKKPDENMLISCMYQIVKYCHIFPIDKRYKLAAQIILSKIFGR